MVTDEDKDLAKLLTGYQDMVGFLHVHKVAQANSQVVKSYNCYKINFVLVCLTTFMLTIRSL